VYLGDLATEALARDRLCRRLKRPLTEALHRCARHPDATVGTTMIYSLSEAATAIGMYRSTVLRAIKAGKVSAVKDEHGQWQIEPAELHRVYPPVADNGADTEATRQYATALAVRAELALADLKTLLDDMRSQRDDAKDDRDRWRHQAEAAQRLLTDATTRAARPWWRRLAG